MSLCDDSKPIAANRQRILVHLYVTGAHALSREASTTVSRVGEEEFGDQFELTTIDLRDSPHMAGVRQILVTPTLVRVGPGAERRLIGDVSDADALRRIFQAWLEEVECHIEC